MSKRRYESRKAMRPTAFNPQKARGTCQASGNLRVKYLTALDAKLALAQSKADRTNHSARRGGDTRTREKVVGPCPHCNHFHLAPGA